MISLSIVTVTRNDLDGLRRTFASLDPRDDPDVEHLIIDGASTDGSSDWARENAVFTNTTVVSEPDSGIFDAMNKALRMASGDIVYFLNSGDCLAQPGVLRKVLDSYRLHGWSWAIGSWRMVDASFRAVRSGQGSGYSWWRQTFWHYTISHQAVFAETEVLRRLGSFDADRFPLAADYHLHTNLGRISPPTMLPILVALMLDGGLSNRRVAQAEAENHEARVDVLRMGGALAGIDRAWSYVLLLKSSTRRRLRRFQRRLGDRYETLALPQYQVGQAK